MRSVSYKSVQDTAAGFLGWDPNNVSTDEQALLNRSIVRRLQFGWEAFFFPEWTVLEKRTFRPQWLSGTAFAAQAETYYAQQLKYFCALQASTNQPPTDGNGVLNQAYWAFSQEEYCATPYSATTLYAQGQQAYFPDTDATYQLFAVSSLGNAPTDATRWGLLVPFERNIDYSQPGKTPIGDVKQTYEENPRVSGRRRAGCEVDFVLQNNGVRVLGCAPVIWLEFRLLAPSWMGPIYVAGASYATGAQVYFNGDFYAALQPVTGQDPTNAAFWGLIPVPYVLAKYAANGAYADVDGMTENNGPNFPTESDAAYAMLLAEFDKIERQQQQDGQLNVVGNTGWR